MVCTFTDPFSRDESPSGPLLVPMSSADEFGFWPDAVVNRPGNSPYSAGEYGPCCMDEVSPPGERIRDRRGGI